jgi:hypothetical protein
MGSCRRVVVESNQDAGRLGVDLRGGQPPGRNATEVGQSRVGIGPKRTGPTHFAEVFFPPVGCLLGGHLSQLSNGQHLKLIDLIGGIVAVFALAALPGCCSDTRVISEQLSPRVCRCAKPLTAAEFALLLFFCLDNLASPHYHANGN